MPLSDETIEALESAKKGKPRKFVMLTKGTSIISLVAYKKGATSKFLKEAKESGKGTPCFGVIEGNASDLVWKLAVADGFKDAPVKDMILKKYLEDEAGIKCKPSFEIVQALPLVLDENDPLHQRFAKAKTAATTAGESNPSLAKSLTELVGQIAGSINSEQREPAEAKLVELETALKAAASGTTTSQSSTSTTATSTATDADTAQVEKQQKSYVALKAKLEPMLEQARSTAPDKAAAFDKVWAYAEAQAAANNFAAANKGLAGLADALLKLRAAGGAGSGAEPDVLAIWRDAKEAADAQLEKFTKALRASGDEYLVEIAEGGIHSFVEGPSQVYVKLQTSLFDYKASQGEKRVAARTKVLESVRGYREFLAASKFLEVCDTNELCGPLTIRSTLSNSLEQLEQAVAT